MANQYKHPTGCTSEAIPEQKENFECFNNAVVCWSRGCVLQNNLPAVYLPRAIDMVCVEYDTSAVSGNLVSPHFSMIGKQLWINTRFSAKFIERRTTSSSWGKCSTNLIDERLCSSTKNRTSWFAIQLVKQETQQMIVFFGDCWTFIATGLWCASNEVGKMVHEFLAITKYASEDLFRIAFYF